jgi:hypothetical protein
MKPNLITLNLIRVLPFFYSCSEGSNRKGGEKAFKRLKAGQPERIFYHVHKNVIVAIILKYRQVGRVNAAT